ncbi:MAG: radical SAM protein [Zoogloeaceae bacterium]|jgi:pyruvate-formate lyase-activating enzyme|nr:radical SAM protein [Zoogloeaceae bacterium]
MDEHFLRVEEHRHDAAGLLYVYPVVSRRAAGLSIGINLNTNRACNWRCVYCQVENLQRGGPPPVDLARLEAELFGFLGNIVAGDYLMRHVPPECRRLADIAFSGEGEPTSAAEFAEAVRCVGDVLERYHLLGTLPVRLITNGSLVHRPKVRAALAVLAEIGGEAWFKVDRADPGGRLRVNHSRAATGRVLANLRLAAGILPTWVQTCWFAWQGRPPDAASREAYLACIRAVADIIKGIHLYGLARPSHQPEAGDLGRLDAAEMLAWGREIEEKTNVKVIVSP